MGSFQPMLHPPVDELLPLHALGALETADHDAVERHLESCGKCGQEYAAWRETAACLAVAAPVAIPTAALRGRVLAAAARQGRLTPWPPLHIRGEGVAKPGVRRPWWALAAAAVLLITLTLGWRVLATFGEIEHLRADNRQLVDEVQRRPTWSSLATSAAARMEELHGTEAAPHAVGVLLFDPSERQGLVVVYGMPPLSEGVYQLWLIRQGTGVSGGVFGVDGRGNGRLVVESPEPLERYESVGITAEPMAMAQPTGTRLVGGALR